MGQRRQPLHYTGFSPAAVDCDGLRRWLRPTVSAGLDWRQLLERSCGHVILIGLPDPEMSQVKSLDPKPKHISQRSPLTEQRWRHSFIQRMACSAEGAATGARGCSGERERLFPKRCSSCWMTRRIFGGFFPRRFCR